jgi:hypothetical protein
MATLIRQQRGQVDRKADSHGVAGRASVSGATGRVRMLHLDDEVRIALLRGVVQLHMRTVEVVQAGDGTDRGGAGQQSAIDWALLGIQMQYGHGPRLAYMLEVSHVPPNKADEPTH